VRSPGLRRGLSTAGPPHGRARSSR
jgi:hypothetical protein